MSSPTLCTSTAEVTIWSKGSEDKLGRQNWGAPYLMYATVDTNGKKEYYTNGVKFVPTSIYWMESSLSDPLIGDKIAKGDQLSFINPDDCNKAEIIKDIKLQDCSFLGEPDDIIILT